MSSPSVGRSSDCEIDAESRIQMSLPKNVELLHRCRVAFTPETPIKQLLTPLDLFPMIFRQYMPWVVFFNYHIDFQRLVDALHTIAQKYLVLCGRLCTDDKGRYAIEVGSVEDKVYDFPVCEMKADMQMAEAVLGHGPITTDYAEFPVEPDYMPFYLDSVDLEAVHKGQGPFLHVKLIHFSDGCCLAMSMSHLVADGMRFAELFRDISRAYCGQEISMRDINRQYMTFEEFSKHFSSEDMEDCAPPQSMPTGREPFHLRRYPKQSCSLEILHLPKELMNDLKSRVTPFIPNGSFVSTADIIQALIWMVACEMDADCGEITNSTDLGIAGTSSIYLADLYSTGLGIIPSNYLGSANIAPILTAGDEVKSKSFLELLSSLALLTRQTQIELKEHPKEVFNHLVKEYTPTSSLPDDLVAAVSNGFKFAISDTDFGGGPPALLLRHPTLPVTGKLCFVSPVCHDAGALVTLLVTKKQKERLRRSSVLRECAPEVKSLFDDFGVAELNSLMKQQ